MQAYNVLDKNYKELQKSQIIFYKLQQDKQQDKPQTGKSH